MTPLVDEVANLVEYPVVLSGSFEEEFLSLPAEVVINAMREHQRYFSVVAPDASLLPVFLTVANTEATDSDVVVKGNERVLRARLSDAKFYFDQDSRVSMDDWVKELKGVVFQKKLGTSYDKVERFTELAALIDMNLKLTGKGRRVRTRQEPRTRGHLKQGRSCKRNRRGVSKASGSDGGRICRHGRRG